ncbi:MAG: hypothetical protein AAFZ09_05865 [Pseudomonadota bacterium]
MLALATLGVVLTQPVRATALPIAFRRDIDAVQAVNAPAVLDARCP